MAEVTARLIWSEHRSLKHMLNGTNYTIRRKLVRENGCIPVISLAFLTSTYHQIFVFKSSVWQQNS